MLDALTLFPAPEAARAIDTRPMIVDSFAGGGGASTGIEMALGRSPDIAINHSPEALALHAANHPEALHLSENVYRVDPLTYLAGKHIGLMWFSPDCKHFSKAKGGAPVKRNIRDLAWIIPGWIERIQKSGGRVDVVLLENVEEFKTWGPLVETEKGLMPDPARAGETFAAWVKALRRLGGKIETRELRGCDYGAPTIRKRLFIVIRFDKRKIVWPKPTHGAPNSPEVLAGKLLPWRSAAECIDWSLPCPSIFDTAPEIMAKHGLRAIRPLKPNTLARIARGMARYVIGAERPFIVNTANGKTNGRGPNAWNADDPLRTITSAGGFAVVSPSITRFNGGATGADLRDPMPTITANSWIKKPGGAMPLGLLAPTLLRTDMTSAVNRNGIYPLQDPLRTQMTSQAFAMMAPYLASIAHGDSGGRREYPLADPLGTVTVGGIQHALVAPHLLALKGSARRSCDVAAPHPTVLAGGGHSAIIAPVLTYAQQGGANRSMTDPHHTICASRKDQNALFAAFLAQHNGGPRMGAHAGHSAANPMSTIAASGSQQTPVAAFFAKYYGTGDGSETCEPLHTITTKDRMGHVQADLAAPPFGPEHQARARAVADFLREYGAWDGGEYVTLTIGGAEFVVIDIGMRMLTPRELFNAQGFPPDYVIEGVWDGLDSETPKFRAFPGHVQVSCCGNSVCPPVAAALVRANCGHFAEIERAEQ